MNLCRILLLGNFDQLNDFFCTVAHSGISGQTVGVLLSKILPSMEGFHPDWHQGTSGLDLGRREVVIYLLFLSRRENRNEA